MNTDPIAKFIDWLSEVEQTAGLAEPTAMTLATCDRHGNPSARIVLMRGIDQRGFVFYTNTESDKGNDLKQNPKAALCFYWMPLNRQVRITGTVQPVGSDEADAYFASRLRESQIGAWASRQSRPLKNREELLDAFEHYRNEFEGRHVPRPPHWAGWRVVPDRIEFWMQQDFRLHEREIYTREGKKWHKGYLYP